MATKPKATKPATQPVAQPVPAVQKPETLVPSASTPLVFIHGNKVVAVTQKQADAFDDAYAQREALYASNALLNAQAKAKAEAQADAQAQNEKEFAQSQRAMKRQPKHIQSLGRNLWKLWG